MRTAPADITRLEPNEIFVFGSNFAGNHGRGAAKDALKFGARNGLGKGRSGNTYAIPTKDANLRVLPLGAIEVGVDRFLRYAVAHPDLTFLVTPIGCGLSHYSPKQIAPMFLKGLLPPNVVLPACFQPVRSAPQPPARIERRH